jgi:hypothetical protein
MYRPVSGDDAVVFPEVLSEAAVVAEKAEPSAEVASLRARVDAAPATPVDLDPIFRSGMYRPVSSDDAVVFPDALSEAAVVTEKAEPNAEVASLRARVDAAPATPVDLDELRDALSKALELSAGDDAGT